MSHSPWNDVPEGVESRTYGIRDLDMHVLEAGTKSQPLILLLHGFPELSYSWRKIILPLAGAGYHVVAPDQRGFGRTRSISAEDRPVHFDDDLAPYRMANLVHDIVALVYGLGHTGAAAVIGHDFGSAVAAHCALIRPDLFASAVCMSAPFTGVPPLPFDVAKLAASSQPRSAPVSPFNALNHFLGNMAPPMKHYTAYFSGPSANGDMLHAPEGLKAFLRAYFHMKSADWPVNDPHPLSSPSELVQMPSYYIMPHGITMPEAVRDNAPSDTEIAHNRWLPDAEFDVYVQEYERTGFQGGLNWYRAATAAVLAEGLSLYHGKKIEIPIMFMGGAKDWGVYQVPGGIDRMRAACPRMADDGVVLIEEAGHWVQQERPSEVLASIFHFLQKTNI